MKQHFSVPPQCSQIPWHADDSANSLQVESTHIQDRCHSVIIIFFFSVAIQAKPVLLNDFMAKLLFSVRGAAANEYFVCVCVSLIVFYEDLSGICVPLIW